MTQVIKAFRYIKRHSIWDNIPNYYHVESLDKSDMCGTLATSDEDVGSWIEYMFRMNLLKQHHNLIIWLVSPKLKVGVPVQKNVDRAEKHSIFLEDNRHTS